MRALHLGLRVTDLDRSLAYGPSATRSSARCRRTRTICKGDVKICGFGAKKS